MSRRQRNTTAPHQAEAYFLPYQVAWLKNQSRFKLWEKSRRIGATYVQSYEDVRDCVLQKIPAVWFSSADESAAKEYILNAKHWVDVFHAALDFAGEKVIDSEKDIKAHVIEFKNGTRIHALSSNPKTFRSKGGKVVIDEFAHHDNDTKLWTAAKPCITWGYPMRIISTHLGNKSLFYRFSESIKKGDLNWSLQTTTIHDAVEQGLVDRILKRTANEDEKAQWLRDERASCVNEHTWLQEYCCIAVDESQAFLPYDLITACEAEDLLRPLSSISGDLYVGMDIGRKKDLSVIWGVEKLGRVCYTRFVTVLEQAPFHVQRDALFAVLGHKSLARACIDATGLGMQLAEEAQLAHGKYRVEAITFTARVKEELAYTVRMHLEDKTLYIPRDHAIREDLHSVRKTTTSANNIRFDVADDEGDGHADRFWALAQALHAASQESTFPRILTGRPREIAQILKGYI